MKDVGEADVMLGIKIIKQNGGLMSNQSCYIKKNFKWFYMFEKAPIFTHMDANNKLLPHKCDAIFQLKYSKIIGYMMYAMTCTKLDKTFIVGNLSRFTQNPSSFH